MNGFDDFNPFPFPSFDRPPGRGRGRGVPFPRLPGRRRRRDRFPRGTVPIVAGVSVGAAIPRGAVPTFPNLPSPSRAPPVQTFPNLPAANDPVFSQVGKLIRIGAVVVNVAVILDGIIRRAQEITINREQKERDAADRQAAQRSGSDNPIRIVVIDPPAPRPSVDPERIILNPLPTAPPVRVDIPLEIPGVQLPAPGILLPEPFEIQAPSTVPEISPGTEFDPIPGFGVPGALPLPSPSPFPAPGTFPVSFPIGSPVSFPVSSPVSFPEFTPVGDPLLPRLTPLGPTAIPLIGTIDLPDPQAQPQAQTRRCQNVQRRRRKKGKCREGFFRERPGSTQFITWRENDC